MPGSLVFLHGFGEDARIWDDFIPDFSWSEKPFVPSFAHWTSAKSIGEYAREILAILPQDGKFNFIGHSMGGYIALEFCKAKIGRAHV